MLRSPQYWRPQPIISIIINLIKILHPHYKWSTSTKSSPISSYLTFCIALYFRSLARNGVYIRWCAIRLDFVYDFASSTSHMLNICCTKLCGTFLCVRLVVWGYHRPAASSLKTRRSVWKLICNHFNKVLIDRQTDRQIVVDTYLLTHLFASHS